MTGDTLCIKCQMLEGNIREMGSEMAGLIVENMNLRAETEKVTFLLAAAILSMPDAKLKITEELLVATHRNPVIEREYDAEKCLHVFRVQP